MKEAAKSGLVLRSCVPYSDDDDAVESEKIAWSIWMKGDVTVSSLVTLWNAHSLSIDRKSCKIVSAAGRQWERGGAKSRRSSTRSGK